MYGHHVATLGLVSLSYFNGWQPIGATRWQSHLLKADDGSTRRSSFCNRIHVGRAQHTLSSRLFRHYRRLATWIPRAPFQCNTLSCCCPEAKDAELPRLCFLATRHIKPSSIPKHADLPILRVSLGLTFKHFRTALLIPWRRCHHKSAHWSLWSGVSTILSIQWCENRCLNVVQFIRGISDVVLYAFQSSRIFKRMPLRFVTQGCQKWNLPCRNLFRFKPDHMVSLSQLGTAMPCFFKVKVWAGVELQGGEGWSQGVSLLRCF